MAANLFAIPGAVGGAAGGGNKPLVEFRAGKMTYTESTKKVTPDKRKGFVQLTQTPDSLIHFIWKDRTTGGVDQDLIIFPEEATFKHVKQCSTGRVYLLEFRASSRKLFFWMQEPSDAKDEEYANKINQYINNPPSGAESGGTSAGGGGGSGGSLPSGVDQNALFQMFSQRAQQQARPSSASGAGGAPVVGMNDLQSILSQIGMPSSAISGMLGGRQGIQPAPSQRGSQPAAQPAQSAQPSSSQARAPRLSTLLNAETVRPLLANQAIQERLLPFLPPERRTPEELRDIFQSPQFQQSLDSFGEALESGQLGELVRQFGLQTSGPTSIQQFLQAVQNTSPQQPPPSGGDKDKKDDDKMDTK